MTNSHFWAIVHDFVGQELSEVSDIVLELEGTRCLYSIAFRFDSDCLIFSAEPDTDTIAVDKCQDIRNWLSHKEERDSLVLENNESCDRFLRTYLTDVWNCQSKAAYTDAVDLAFGDLNHPNLKILCLGSELVLMSIERLD